MKTFKSGLRAHALLVQLLASVSSAVRGTSMLLPGVVSLSALALSSSVGCSDENAPETWVKRLDDVAKRSEAIKRLGQFYEDAYTKAKRNVSDPEVQKVLNVIIDPLTKQYEAGNLDEKTRKELAKLLSNIRDPRSQTAFTKMFKDYAPGKNDEDARAAAEAVTALAKEGKLSDQNTIDALWNLFDKFKPTETKFSSLAQSIGASILAVKHPSYAPKAVQKLGETVTDPKDPIQGMNLIQFSQATSIRLLKELNYKEAARALVTVLLTKNKGDLELPAMIALAQMPAEAETLLVSALDGSDPEFAKKTAEWGPEKMYLAPIVRVLGFIGRPKGQAAVLSVLPSVTNDTLRVDLTRTLGQYPKSQEVTDAYVASYSKLGKDSLYGSTPAKASVLSVGFSLYNSALVPFTIKETKAAKGEGVEEAMHAAGIGSLIKMYEESGTKDVKDVVEKYGLPGEKDAFKTADMVVQKCKKDASCYVSILDEPIASTPSAAKIRFVKAAFMAGAFGNEKTKQELSSRLDKIKDPSLRTDVALALDKLAPKGDAELAAKLDKIVATEGATAANDIYTKVALKLRARSLP